MQQDPGSHELSILNHLPMGLFALDREWRFTYLNPTAQRFFQKVCHRSPPELLGQIIWDSCPEVADSTFAWEHQQALAEQRTFELEVFFPTLQRWFLILAFVAEERHYFYLKDTTEPKRLERELRVQIEQMRTADRGKVEFLAHLAQKVRNTLGILHNTFGLARQRPDAAEHALVMGEKIVADLSPLMDDLAKLAQLMLGQVEPGQEPVDLTPIAAQVAEGVIALPEARGRIFTVGLPPQPLWVAADPEHLRKAVHHLLHNAVAQTRPGDHVWLTAESQSGQVVLHVEDDGVGITPEVLPHVFDLFVESEPKTERTQEKLRIGLALVRHLIELHGGKVEVCSDGPGGGSEFTVSLPEALAAFADSNPAPAGTRVLVVDSNAMEAESLAELLNRWRYETRVAVDGPTAVLQAASWHPLVVLVEVAPSGMDGFEVARLLRAQAGPSAAILIAILANGQEKDWQATKEAGFDYFAVKPVPPEELRELLDAAVVRASQNALTPPL
jgi:signal transduction histidine kinase/CheY-like chemotaxis protein